MSETGLELDAAASVMLPVSEWGPADAPRTALLLHGLSSAGAVWWRVADALAAEGFRVVAPDLRGHGRAPRTRRYPLGGFAADVLRLRAGAGRLWDVVVGHSLGGATAVLAASSDAGWADSLLLVDPALRHGSADPAAAAAFRAVAIAEAEAPDAGAIAAAHPDWHQEDVYLKVRAAREISRHTVTGVLDDTPGWGGLVMAFERIAAPVTVLGADPTQRDAAVSRELGERLAASHARVEYLVAEGSGHSIHRSDPERVVAEALAIVGRARETA